jgi:hypothetical protein
MTPSIPKVAAPTILEPLAGSPGPGSGSTMATTMKNTNDVRPTLTFHDCIQCAWDRFGVITGAPGYSGTCTEITSV